MKLHKDRACEALQGLAGTLGMSLEEVRGCSSKNLLYVEVQNMSDVGQWIDTFE